MKKPAKIEELNRNLALRKEDRNVPSVGIDAELAIDEQYIENCLKGAGSKMTDAYERLKKVKSEKRYTERTFEIYMKHRWGHSASWAYKLIRANVNVENFPQTSVENKQLKENLNQSQATALGEAEPEEQAEILKEIAKEGKVTAKKIAEKIKEKSEPKEADFQDVIKDEEPISEDVDEVTGLIGECEKPDCADNRRLVKVLERKIRGLNLELGRLREDKEEEMKHSPFYKNAIKVFDYWKEKTKHPKSKFGLDVFKQVLPFLKSDGIELCMMAVEGIAFQHHKDVRLNGTDKHYDSWELLFRNRAKFEEFACRSPRHKKEKVKP